MDIRPEKSLCDSCLWKLLIGPVFGTEPRFTEAAWLLHFSSIQALRLNPPSPMFLASKQHGPCLQLHLFFFFNFIYLFIYLRLCWIFVSVRGLSLVAASGGHSSSRCAGLSLSWPLLLWSTGSRRAGSVIVAHGPSCSEACGIFPDQGSNPCSLRWQADSQPLCHQGSPTFFFFNKEIIKVFDGIKK